jgi:hypothetical protein
MTGSVAPVRLKKTRQNKRPEPRSDSIGAEKALVDEFSTELATDPPCQPALTQLACRQRDREDRRNFGIFGDHLQATLRHVRDRAIARQRAGPELDFGSPSAFLTFASTSIHQHVDPLSRTKFGSSAITLGLQQDHWNTPSETPRNLSVIFDFLLPCGLGQGRQDPARPSAAEIIFFVRSCGR